MVSFLSLSSVFHFSLQIPVNMQIGADTSQHEKDVQLQRANREKICAMKI